MRLKTTKVYFRIIPGLLCFLLTSTALYSQPLNITGKVTSADGSGPMLGVTIIVKGTMKGTISSPTGEYNITADSPKDTLVFSYVGYETKEIPVANQSRIEVVLNLEKTKLEEVVVIGYGTIKKSDLTGSVSSVKAIDITKITSVSPEQSLQGKVTGVQVTSLSGAPGAIPTVRVRGVGTFNNSSPIFVVDGVILDNISFLNSGDISSMEVLKDASATAIYGSRGANGVIIITTKSGKIGQEKPVFDYTSEYGMQKLARKIDLLNGKEFAIISNEIATGSYNNVDLVPNTDWQDLVFQTTPIQNHQFSVSGATTASQYYVGVGILKQNGIIDKSGYERVTLKFNNTYSLTKFLKLGNQISISPYRQQNAPNVTYSVYRALPLLLPYNTDGSFGGVNNVGNPLADLSYSNDFNKGVRGVGHIFMEARILKSFTLKSSFGMDAAFNKSESFTPAYTVYNSDGSTSQQQNNLSDLYKGNNQNQTWIWENTVNFNRQFEKHSFDVLAGYTMQETRSEEFKIHGENMIRDGKDFWYILPSYIIDKSNNLNTLQDLDNKVDPNLFYSMISYLFRTNYTYNGKYILTMTFRRDGSSKFRQENRYGNFPSFAAGWNIGREDFMKNYSLISNLKIRGSWGIIGNEKIPYDGRFALVSSNLLAVFGRDAAINSAASFGNSGNPDLKWENTEQTDLGIEAGILNNRITAEFDYYNRDTKDILIPLSTPGHLGNGQGERITYNAAEILNSGFEFNINWRETRDDFNYGIGILGSTIHNEVLKVGGSSGIDSVLLGGYLGNGLPVTQSRVGLPIGAFYGYKTNGIFQSQAELDAYPHDPNAEIGDLRFVDVNGDSAINGQDRTYIGSPIPKFIFGFNFFVEYKGFDFAIDFQGQTGNNIFNGKDAVRPDPYNFEKHVFDRWTGPGTSNSEPKPSFGGYNYTPSDRFILDGSFLRLRNLSLGYTLPLSVTNKFSIEKLRVYVKGSNLFTLTKYTGYTPEIGSNDVLSNGIDNGIYPVTSVYSIGINLSF